MTILVLLYILVLPVFGFEYKANCSNESKKLTFEEVKDGVDGRYKVEWCTNLQHYNYTWDLNLLYFENLPPEDCKPSSQVRRSQKHSYAQFQINRNCPNTICLTTYTDLIFNGTCFQIQTTLKRKSSGHDLSNPADERFIFVYNKFPKEQFTGSKILATHTELNDKELVIFMTGHIPVTDYDVQLCNETHEYCKYVNDNCTSEGLKSNGIKCFLKESPGCYQLMFMQISPWSYADIFESQISKRYNVCLTSTELDPPASDEWGSGTTAAMWWGGAAVVLGLTALALVILFTIRTGRGRQLSHQVLEHWLKRSEPVPPRKAVPAGTRVLLIYARDCPPFTRAVQILAAALRRTGCQVVDIFSTETAVQSARAPNEWLRRLVADPGTRLLLLQTPAGCTYYCPQLTQQGSPTLSAPLLGGAAVRRSPHAADNLAMMAWRLFGEAAVVHPLAYRKFYVATIAGLGCDNMVPGVTPLRRYELPAYANVLLRDLAPGADNDLSTDDSLPTKASDTSDLLQDLACALNEMCEYVRDHPNYLTDELFYY